MGEPVRVLIVDEWAVAAEQLRRDLSEVEGVTVVGVARTAAEAGRLAAAHRADVAVVDVGVRGGATAAGVPTVALCGDDRATVSAALFAVEGGAVDVWVRGSDLELLGRRLRAVVNRSRGDLAVAGRRAGGSTAGCLVVLAAGIGGTVSLGSVLAALPGDTAGVVVTGLPAAAVPLWADRAGRRSTVRVGVAAGVDAIVPGRVWVAPGDCHLSVCPTPGGLAVVVRDGPAFGGNRPSLDVLLTSAAECGGPRVIAAVMGGTGTDGVGGLGAVRRAGGRTLAESSATAACGELPGAAVHYAAAETAIGADAMAAAMASLAAGQRANRAA